MNEIEKILGIKCKLHQHFPLDSCRACTGYRSYAKSIECEHYMPNIEHARQTKPKQLVETESKYASFDEDTRPLWREDKTAETYNLANCCNEFYESEEEFQHAFYFHHYDLTMKKPVVPRAVLLGFIRQGLRGIL